MVLYGVGFAETGAELAVNVGNFEDLLRAGTIFLTTIVELLRDNRYVLLSLAQNGSDHSAKFSFV